MKMKMNLYLLLALSLQGVATLKASYQKTVKQYIGNQKGGGVGQLITDIQGGRNLISTDQIQTYIENVSYHRDAAEQIAKKYTAKAKSIFNTAKTKTESTKKASLYSNAVKTMNEHLNGMTEYLKNQRNRNEKIYNGGGYRKESITTIYPEEAAAVSHW